MPSAAFHAHGSILEVLDGTFFPVIEVSVLALGYTADELDISNHESLQAWREFVRGLKSCELLVEGNLIIASDSHGWSSTRGLMTLFDSGQLAVWRLIFPDASPLLFTAFVAEYTWSNDVEDAIRFSARLRVSGSVEEGQIIIDLWDENFNYAALDNGTFTLQYLEPWDYYNEEDWVLQYTEPWTYSLYQTAELKYTEPWEFNYPSTVQLEYLEEWES